jgi:outer membrane protein OmpA-like peptidoglycan-associated protein
VARELVRLGVPATAIETGAVGSSEDVVACPRPAEAAERRRYLACLEPNRRVVVHIDGP